MTEEARITGRTASFDTRLAILSGACLNMISSVNGAIMQDQKIYWRMMGSVSSYCAFGTGSKKVCTEITRAIHAIQRNIPKRTFLNLPTNVVSGFSRMNFILLLFKD